MVQNNSVDERAGQKVYYTHTQAKKKGTTRKLKEYWVAVKLESLETVRTHADKRYISVIIIIINSWFISKSCRA